MIDSYGERERSTGKGACKDSLQEAQKWEHFHIPGPVSERGQRVRILEHLSASGGIQGR